MKQRNPITGRNVSSQKTGVANPAATYAKEQGLKYEITNNPDGSQAGRVMVNGQWVDSWDYYRQNHPVSEPTPQYETGLLKHDVKIANRKNNPAKPIRRVKSTPSRTKPKPVLATSNPIRQTNSYYNDFIMSGTKPQRRQQVALKSFRLGNRPTRELSKFGKKLRGW